MIWDAARGRADELNRRVLLMLDDNKNPESCLATRLREHHSHRLQLSRERVKD